MRPSSFEFVPSCDRDSLLWVVPLLNVQDAEPPRLYLNAASMRLFFHRRFLDAKVNNQKQTIEMKKRSILTDSESKPTVANVAFLFKSSQSSALQSLFGTTRRKRDCGLEQLKDLSKIFKVARTSQSPVGEDENQNTLQSF